uniref:Uncharacterized protein n=1 Tax=Ficedula albicollis TaxID=59894 RepID=A0A803VBU5_FICAL
MCLCSPWQSPAWCRSSSPGEPHGSGPRGPCARWSLGDPAPLSPSAGTGALAQWVLVELQGEVQPRQSGDLAGSLLGDLHYTCEHHGGGTEIPVKSTGGWKILEWGVGSAASSAPHQDAP